MIFEGIDFESGIIFDIKSENDTEDFFENS